MNIYSQKHISLLFFLSKIDKIKKLISDLEQIYSDCDEDLKTERVLIEKDLLGRNISSDFIEIENPFEMIPTLIENVNNLLRIFESDKESINMDSFSYKGQFQLLSSFISDIQDKDLDEEEIKDLTNIWNCLMLKGFILNQIKVKLNEDEIRNLQNDESFADKLREKKMENTPKDIQDLANAYDLITHFHYIFTNSEDINEEKLNQIYQNHLNDESGAVLKPIIEELIPYYKSLITPNGSVKLTYELTNQYPKIRCSEITIKDKLNGSYVNPIYFHYLVPFVLIDSPGKNYDDLLNRLILYLQKATSSFVILDASYPRNFEEVTKLDTLNNQKYYIVKYLFDYLYRQINFPQLGFQDFCLVWSLLPWKIDADCQEARDLEEYINNMIQTNLKKYTFDSTAHYTFKNYAHYIINTINKAQQPLDPDSIKEHLEHNAKQSRNGGTPEGGCCTIQ